jgi:hypothetical protein
MFLHSLAAARGMLDSVGYRQLPRGGKKSGILGHKAQFS